MWMEKLVVVGPGGYDRQMHSESNDSMKTFNEL